MVMLDEAVASDAQSVITGCAHALARDYYGFTTAADISQELWVWVLKHRAKVNEWLDREEQDDRNRGAKALQKTLLRVGSVYCRREKAAQVGYLTQDEYFYTRSLVAALVQARFNDGKMVINVVDDTPRKAKLDSEGNDILALLSDVDRAMEVLSPDQLQLVTEVHGFDVPVQEIAERDGVTRQAVENRLNRAVDKMIKFLGGDYPY